MKEQMAAQAGLGAYGSLAPMAAGIVILLLVVKFFTLPFKLVWNGIVGAAMLWGINLVGSMAGFSMKITVIKALIAGVFGIPGALAVVLFEIFGK